MSFCPCGSTSWQHTRCRSAASLHEVQKQYRVLYIEISSTIYMYYKGNSTIPANPVVALLLSNLEPYYQLAVGST